MHKHEGNHFVVGALSAAAIGTFAGHARAETRCGSSPPAGWNAPAGAAVFEQDDPNKATIAAVIAALNEKRSHSMLSHGPNTWVSHATATIAPSVANCDNPVDKNFMGASTPGMSVINQGGAYTFLYNNGGVPVQLTYQNATSAIPNSGTLLANQLLPTDEWGDVWTWNGMNVNGNTVFGLNFAFNNGTPTMPVLQAAGQIYYGWYQYFQIGSTAQGYPPPQTGGAGLAKGYGVTCSSVLAMEHHDALHAQPGYTGDVLPRTYGSTAITAAGNALFGAIYNKCKGSTNTSDGGEFLVSAWAGGACLGISVCSNAGNQIVNAFASPGGFIDDVGADWQNIVAHNSATSISPDDVGCWNGNGTGAPCSGTGSSAWGWDGDNVVQWNSPGSTYGCW